MTRYWVSIHVIASATKAAHHDTCTDIIPYQLSHHALPFVLVMRPQNYQFPGVMTAEKAGYLGYVRIRICRAVK